MTLRICLIALLLAAALPAHADRQHIVQPGETLWLISARLGDPFRWPELYRANRDQIRDPSLLYPGQILTIPELRLGDARDPASAVSAPPPQERAGELPASP